MPATAFDTNRLALTALVQTIVLKHLGIRARSSLWADCFGKVHDVGVFSDRMENEAIYAGVRFNSAR